MFFLLAIQKAVDKTTSRRLVYCHAVIYRGQVAGITMIPSSDEKFTIGELVIERCNAQARRWKAYGDDAFGAVFLKVCDNLQSLGHLQKPLEHYCGLVQSQVTNRSVWRS